VVSAFLAATATKVAVYVLLRFMYGVFGSSFAFDSMPLQFILMVLGALAVLSGSTVAVFQHNIKRMLGYSSVAQIGYMILGLSLASVSGLTATLVHLLNHALMKGGLFLAVACMAYHLGGTRLADLAGAGHRMPWTSAAFVVGGLSLIGVPLTAGFISKWMLVVAVLETGWWPLLIVIAAGSLLAVAYIWRVIEMIYFRSAATADGPPQEAHWSLLAPVWLLIAANIYFGIDTQWSVDVARLAAQLLFGVHA
jgi:multicomponent Na+:H+ antiporter subunit D